MKILSMYLPQFHRVKENDEWWGEGYTDWISAKNAVPLYEGHYQPHIPKNQYFYDLTEKTALNWQVSLMKKYGIDGQCIYHYWFKDGRQILEKPAENLLRWKDIDMPFCFSWANQSWANSWSAVKGANIWCDTRETGKKTENANGLLLEQQYGDEKEWRSHFEYLLPFFKDERYIKIDHKPVFVLYQAMYITVLDKMSECWNRWAIAEGFEGIYFIGVSNRDESLVDAVLYPGPQTAMSELLQELDGSELKILEYQEVWYRMLDKAFIEKDCMVGAFTGYDDTPRRASKGCVIEHASPSIFRDCFTKLLAINEIHNQPFTFINAWNEWGEGMHLEPDERYGVAYLEAVFYAKSHYKEYLAETEKIEKSFYQKYREGIENYKRTIKRYESYWRIMDQWLLWKERGKTVVDVLKAQNIRNIAIYGIGMLGRHLIHDLSDSDINIVCGIDKYANNEKMAFSMIKPEEDIPKVDAIIVTPIYDFLSIKQYLEKKGCKNIISLEALFS